MNKILFPTEFSTHAPEIFRYAVELAYFFNARLVMMYAYGSSEFEMVPNLNNEGQANMATDKMIDFVTKNLPEEYRKDIQVDYVSRKGLSSKAILEVALEEDIDLIVMGMTGKTDALETLVGSTAMHVLAKSECPLLLIPATAKFAGIDNIVYTTNFEFRDLEAIQYLKKWSKVFKAPLHCVHLVGQGEMELRAIKDMDILEKTFKRQKRMHFDLVKGYLEEEIDHYAKEKKADLVAMMAHKRSFITRLLDKSKVKGVAQEISIPLLVIKDNAYELDTLSEDWLRIVNSIA